MPNTSLGSALGLTSAVRLECNSLGNETGTTDWNSSCCHALNSLNIPKPHSPDLYQGAEASRVEMKGEHPMK